MLSMACALAASFSGIVLSDWEYNVGCPSLLSNVE